VVVVAAHIERGSVSQQDETGRGGLKARGIITNEEFEVKKKLLLGL